MTGNERKMMQITQRVAVLEISSLVIRQSVKRLRKEIKTEDPGKR